MRALALLLPLVLAGCGDAPRTKAEASVETTNYDAINEAARGPGHLIDPQAIQATELVDDQPFKCVFSGEGEREVLFIATPSIGIMRIDGEDVRFSPVPTVNPLAYDISDRFDAMAYRVELAVDRQSDTSDHPEQPIFQGRMRVSDEHERIVYDQSGKVECRANG